MNITHPPPLLPRLLPWLLPGALLLIGGPLFICMPLWCDATHYDVAARNLLHGGVHYRDVFDTNLPGMVWLHTAIRSTLGWRPELLRGADLLVVLGILALLCRWLPRRSPARPALFFSGLAFYLSTPEINHVQRDVWMLLPSLAALALRCEELQSPPRVWLTLIEGLLWAAACWIKPFVLVPMLALMGVGMWRKRVRKIEPEPSPIRPSAFIAWLAGFGAGLLVGFVWLWLSGALPYFIEVFAEWNPEYAAGGSMLAGRIGNPLAWAIGAFPWSVPVLVSVILAVVQLRRSLVRPKPAAEPIDHDERYPDSLLAALLLGWLLQALLLQHPNFYVLTPLVLLSLGYLATTAAMIQRKVWLTALVLLLAVAVWRHPLCSLDRLALWPRCVQEVSTPELRDRLALMDPRSLGLTRWQELQKVADYLRGRGVRDGEVICFQNATHPIYLELNIEPSVRYMQVSTVLNSFPTKRARVEAELQRLSQRFLVSDEAELLAEPARKEELLRQLPWNQPVVFRAGRYRVHEVR
jgi:hypothetical protein